LKVNFIFVRRITLDPEPAGVDGVQIRAGLPNCVVISKRSGWLCRKLQR